MRVRRTAPPLPNRYRAAAGGTRPSLASDAVRGRSSARDANPRQVASVNCRQQKHHLTLLLAFFNALQTPYGMHNRRASFCGECPDKACLIRDIPRMTRAGNAILKCAPGCRTTRYLRVHNLCETSLAWQQWLIACKSRQFPSRNADLFILVQLLTGSRTCRVCKTSKQ